MTINIFAKLLQSRKFILSLAAFVGTTCGSGELAEVKDGEVRESKKRKF